MNLIKEIESSIYNPTYYRHVLERPFSYSVRYYLAFAAVVALVATASLSLSLVPQLYTFLDRFGTEILATFPADLIVTVKGGELSINRTEPVIIPLPATSRGRLNSGFLLPASTTNLFVINPKADFKAEDLDNQRTLVLVDHDQLFYRNDKNQIVVQSLKQTPDIIISRQLIASLFNQVRPIIKLLAPVMVLIIFILFSVVLALNFIYLLLGALLIMLLSRAKGLALSYGKAYQVGLHAITASVLFEYLTFVFLPQKQLLIIPTVIMLIVVGLNLRSPHRA